MYLADTHLGIRPLDVSACDFSHSLEHIHLTQALAMDEDRLQRIKHALVGGAPEAYGSCRVCLYVCVCYSAACFSLQPQ